MEDDELIEQIKNERPREEETSPGPVETVVPKPAPSTSKLARLLQIPAWAKIGVVFVVLGGGVVFLLAGTSASDAFVYSKLVDEVMSEPDEYVGRELRVEGQLRRGSVRFIAEPTCEHRFVLARGEHEMPVRFPRCVVPDTFRDDMPMDVVVQGQLQDNGTFLADQVIPRCPSKYEMRQRQQDGEAVPHAAVPGATEPS